MKLNKKFAALAGVALVGGLGLTGCSFDNSADYRERVEKQKTTELKESLETRNLEKKRDLENDPNALRYVYLLTYGDIVGFYTIQGKVSSSASQLAPESELVDPPGDGYTYYSVDSAKDDGSFGQGDPGIFFFTTEGVLVETDLNYLVSNSPIPIDVPRLNDSQ